MVVVALLSVYLVESVYVVSVELVVNCTLVHFCRMYGLFQTAFYFGYMALFAAALGMMCGTLGYFGTSLFVRKIYSTVKID